MKRLIASFVCVLLFATAANAQEQYPEVKAQAAIYEQGFIQVIGESEAGQTRFKAKRAAKVVAQRDMLEIVKGLNLIGGTTVQDGMIASSTIQTTVKGFLQGAVVVHEEYMQGEGYARVVLRMPLRGEQSIYSSMAPVIKQPPAELKVEPLPEFKPVEQAAAPAPTPKEEPKPYDGLILIVEGTGFKPALANRIVTEDQNILFEPSKVSPQMLIERGCGGYTTTEDKAKALLATWGSKNPMIVKCSKVKKGTEAVVTVEDATAIFEQNSKNNMLPQAKVVFVL